MSAPGVVFPKGTDPWKSVGGGNQGASSTGGAGGWLSAGLSLLGGRRSQPSAAGAGASSYSGMGGFAADNEFAPKYKKPLIDLKNPVHILVAGLLVFGGIYAYKRLK